MPGHVPSHPYGTGPTVDVSIPSEPHHLSCTLTSSRTSRFTKSSSGQLSMMSVLRVLILSCLNKQNKQINRQISKCASKVLRRQ